MSQSETSVGGNPVRTINASAGDEPYTLPVMASGRSVTILREDPSAFSVVVSVPSGHTLDGVLNGKVYVPGNAQWLFKATNPGVWESYGAGGSPGTAVSDLLADAVTYNADGTVATSTTGGVTTTYAYNADGTVHTEARLGKTKTYTYDASGNVTGSVVA